LRGIHKVVIHYVVSAQLRRRMNQITSLREEEEWILEGGQ